jgi:uncharacterized protein (UPF0261 family)
MTKTVVLAGAFDTKGADYAYVQSLLHAAGLQTLTVDFGVMGTPAFNPDVDRQRVAAEGGGDLHYLAAGDRKDEAMQVMARGLAAVVRRLYDEGQLDGILAMGGSGGTSLATTAMRALPVGLPKVMVSTMGGGDVTAYSGAKDIVFIPSIVDVAGLNRISRTIYANAAGAIAGMVQMQQPAVQNERPLVTASMFGNSTTCVEAARAIVEEEGYEVLIFHATGAGGRTMEGLIADGYVTASMDITTTELADTVCGGIFSAGPERCLAASRAGIPAVLVPGCIDMANFGHIETVPERYRGRNLYQWNPNVTLLRTNAEENRQIGEMLAAAANAATAPVAILLPLRGVSMLDSPGGRFWDPDADQACYQAIKRTLRPNIPLYELDHNINDPEFSAAVAHTFLALLDEQ